MYTFTLLMSSHLQMKGNMIILSIKKILMDKRIDALLWVALVSVDPLFYYIPTVDSNVSIHNNYALLICVWILYLPLLAYRFYRCSITRKDRLLIILAETSLLSINHAVSLWSVIFDPAVEFPSPLSVIFMFIVVGAYLGRVYALFRWFTKFVSQIMTDRQHIVAVWTLIGVFVYIYGGYIFGSFWYYLATCKKIICWKHSCISMSGCRFSRSNFSLNLEERKLLNDHCSVNGQNELELGIFKDAFESGIIEQKRLWKKVFLCLRWGVQTLSSFASVHMKYNWDDWESAFVLSMCIYSIVTLGFFMSSLNLVPRRRSRTRQLRRAPILPR